MREKKQRGGSVKPIFKLLYYLMQWLLWDSPRERAECWAMPVLREEHTPEQSMPGSVCLQPGRSTHTQGWLQSFPGHLQAVRGSVHTQAGLALSADSEGCSKAAWIYPQRGQNYRELPEHLLSAGFPLSHPPTESELNCGISALLSHSSAGKSDSLWHYTRADLSAAAFLPHSAEAHHTEQLLSPQGTSCRGLNSNTLVPKLHEEGCKLLILQ